MSYKIGAVVLAGHNNGIKSRLREYLDKSLMGFLYGEEFIFWKNKALLHVENPNDGDAKRGEAQRNIEYVVNNLSSSRYIDSQFIIPVGPQKDIEEVLNIDVVEQGNNLSSNVIKGLDALYNKAGYNGDYSLICCGDIPLPKGKHYDEFIEKCLSSSDNAEVYMGICSRGELKHFINNSPFVVHGRVGINFPMLIIRNLNKFGVPFVDKKGEFGTKGKVHYLTSGNVFLVNNSVKERKDIADRIYTSKRLFFNPKNWPALIKEFAPYNIYKVLLKQKVSITEIEEALSRILDVNLKIIKTNYLFSLDADTRRDQGRNSAILHNQLYEEL